MTQSIAHMVPVVRDYDEAILFLQADDFQRDYDRMVSRGITFVRPPKAESYGTVAVFHDLYGNLWDLIQFNTPDA